MSYESPVSPYLTNGQQAVTAAAVALPSTLFSNEVRIRNISTSTASVFVGTSAVTATTGHEIPVGGEIVLKVQNLNQVYVIAAAAGTSRVSWVGN